MQEAPPAPPRPGWITPTILGIVMATLFSDFSHEMVTSVLPSYLISLGLGSAALGVIEGVADFLVSLAKLGGGAAGQRLGRKKPLIVLGYLVTTLGTSSLGFARELTWLAALRTTAWIGRGFRGPLKDFVLADEVERTHYGRAYGLERAGDMVGAVAGPAFAAALGALGLGYRSIMLWALLPGMAAALSISGLVRERRPESGGIPPAGLAPRGSFPKAFWILLVGIVLFGLGDFSRTFLILIAARSLGSAQLLDGKGLTLPVLLYAGHNLVSALAAFPAGRCADRVSKVRLLMGGYGLGVATNLVLAYRGGTVSWVIGAMVLSGITVSVREVVEKASVAQLLPRTARSLGLGILAFASALGDLASSLAVGFLLDRESPELAFGIAALAGLLGVLWLGATLGRIEPGGPAPERTPA